MESINKRNQLVDKLVAKIREEYSEERDMFFSHCLAVNDGAECPEHTTEVLELISFKSTFLMWVQKEILDADGRMFRLYMQSDGEDQAQFYVDTECIEILLSEDRTLLAIASRFRFNYQGLYALLHMDERNADRVLVSILDRVIHKKS